MDNHSRTFEWSCRAHNAFLSFFCLLHVIISPCFFSISCGASSSSQLTIQPHTFLLSNWRNHETKSMPRSRTVVFKHQNLQDAETKPYYGSLRFRFLCCRPVVMGIRIALYRWQAPLWKWMPLWEDVNIFLDWHNILNLATTCWVWDTFSKCRCLLPA